MSERFIIDGHPEVEAISPTCGQVNRISVCAECGSLKSILFLSADRWYCHQCKNAGSWKPKVIPVSRPTRRR